MRLQSVATPLLIIGLTLNASRISATESSNDPSETEARAAVCTECIKSRLYSVMGIKLFEEVPILTRKPCLPPKRFLIQTTSEKGILLVHTIELLAKRMERDSLKKEAASKSGDSAAEARMQIARDNELIKSLRSEVEAYAQIVKEKEYPGITKSAIWTVGYFDSYWSYLDRIHPNIKLGVDYEIICDHTREARK